MDAISHRHDHQSTTFQTVSDFFSRQGRTNVLLHGPLEAVCLLAHSIEVGYVRHEERRHDGLAALAVSLEPFWYAQNHDPVTMSNNLASVLESQSFKDLVMAHISGGQDLEERVLNKMTDEILNFPNISLLGLSVVLRLHEEHMPGYYFAIGTCRHSGFTSDGTQMFEVFVHPRISPSDLTPESRLTVIWLADLRTSPTDVPRWNGFTPFTPSSVLSLKEPSPVAWRSERTQLRAESGTDGVLEKVNNRDEASRLEERANPGAQLDNPEIDVLFPQNTASPEMLEGRLRRDRYPTGMTAQELVDRHPDQLFEELLLFAILRYEQKVLIKILEAKGLGIRYDTLRQRKHAALQARHDRLHGLGRKTQESWRAVYSAYNREIVDAGHYTPRKKNAEGSWTQGGPTYAARKKKSNKPYNLRRRRKKDLHETSVEMGLSSPASIHSFGDDSDPEILQSYRTPATAEDQQNYVPQTEASVTGGEQGLKPFLGVNYMEPASQGPSWPPSAALRHHSNSQLTNDNVGESSSSGVEQRPESLTAVQTMRIFRKCSSEQSRNNDRVLGVGPPGLPLVPFIWYRNFDPPMLSQDQIRWYKDPERWERLPEHQKNKIRSMSPS